MLKLKKPIVIKLKNCWLIWKNKKEFFKVYNPGSIKLYYNVLAGKAK
jgi:hypothetical protein